MPEGLAKVLIKLFQKFAAGGTQQRRVPCCPGLSRLFIALFLSVSSRFTKLVVDLGFLFDFRFPFL
jgi:hypothetical protein